MWSLCALLAHKQTSKQKTKTKNEKKETSTWKENEDEWRNWIIFTLTFSLLFIHFFFLLLFHGKSLRFCFLSFVLFCFQESVNVCVCVPGTTTTTTKLLRVDNNKRFAIFFCLFVHQSCLVSLNFILVSKTNEKHLNYIYSIKSQKKKKEKPTHTHT